MLVSNSEDQMIVQPSAVACEEKLLNLLLQQILEEPSTMAMDSNQPNNSSSLNGSVHEQVCDSSDMFSQEKNGMDEETTINNRRVPNGVLDKADVEVFEDTNNKDEECKLLRKGEDL